MVVVRCEDKFQVEENKGEESEEWVEVADE
jgi:hypothetical protein